MLQEFTLSHRGRTSEKSLQKDVRIYPYGNQNQCAAETSTQQNVNTSGKVGAQIPHPPLGDDSSPWGR
jgi:hypothetical protein